MKRLHVTAEGQTEESFVNQTLKHHLAKYGVFADVRCVLTSRGHHKEFRGGMTNYARAKDDIDDGRFIPYIQLHEFETLLFADPRKFEIEYFDRPEGITQLCGIAAEFGNPELINQGRNTAPSKRIIKVYSDYEGNKPAIGSMVAHEIGVETLKRACSHFRGWIEKLEKLV